MDTNAVIAACVSFIVTVFAITSGPVLWRSWSAHRIMQKAARRLQEREQAALRQNMNEELRSAREHLTSMQQMLRQMRESRWEPIAPFPEPEPPTQPEPAIQHGERNLEL